MNQYTLSNTYVFKGRGLHTGKEATVKVGPAAEDTGIIFYRIDAAVRIPARADRISRTDRCTILTEDGVSVFTIEHLLSALTGLGVDNAFVEIDNDEVPILDGSALPYVSAFLADGLVEQAAPRRYITIDEEIEVKDEQTGSWVRVTPADKFSCEVTVDFNSRVLGVQSASWTEGDDYAGQLAPCRTFCFFHELEFLASKGLVKGGDVDNAIVIVEHPVTREQVDRMASIFNQPRLDVTEAGYLSNLTLRFDNECGRHKLLDLIGDIRLAGGFLKAHVSAYKPGHTINSVLTKKIVSKILVNG